MKVNADSCDWDDIAGKVSVRWIILVSCSGLERVKATCQLNGAE